jgi:predicted ArsR family transcriptional regulator
MTTGRVVRVTCPTCCGRGRVRDPELTRTLRALETRPRDAGEIAERLGVSPRQAETLLAALFANHVNGVIRTGNGRGFRYRWRLRGKDDDE